MKLIILIYTCIIFSGGVFGYLSGSRISLISGLVSGSLLLCAYVGALLNKNWGFYLALFVAFTLDVVFTVRYLKTFKFIPAGTLSILSLGTFILIARYITKNIIKKRQ